MFNYLLELDIIAQFNVVFGVLFAIYKAATTKRKKTFIAFAFLSLLPFFAYMMNFLQICEELKLALNDYEEPNKYKQIQSMM